MGVMRKVPPTAAAVRCPLHLVGGLVGSPAGLFVVVLVVLDPGAGGGVHARGVCAGGVLVMYSQYGPSVFGNLRWQLSAAGASVRIG